MAALGSDNTWSLLMASWGPTSASCFLQDDIINTKQEEIAIVDKSFMYFILLMLMNDNFIKG